MILFFLQITDTTIIDSSVIIPRSINVLDMISRGGWLMIPIAILLFYIIYVFFERLFTLKRTKGAGENFKVSLRSMLINGKTEEARILCEKTEGPIARMLASGLAVYSQGRESIRTAIEDSAKSEIYNLEKGLGGLSTTAAIAPMLGFLGTVTGMIQAFISIESLGGNVNASVLAGGIWEALMTTAAGLFVGIPAIFMHNYILSKIKDVVHNMEESAREMLELLHRKY